MPVFTLDRVNQDMLNLLSIWFRHGVIPDVYEAMMHDEWNINSITLDCWLGVVPQLIACMNHKDRGCREALHDLLMRLGKRHPQVGMNALQGGRAREAFSKMATERVGE